MDLPEQTIDDLLKRLRRVEGQIRGIQQMLHDGGNDHVAGFERQPVGEVVDRLGGVAADDGNESVPVRPANAAKASRACSYAAVASCDFQPAPRWTLEYHGRNASTRDATPGKAPVDAAASSERYERPTWADPGPGDESQSVLLLGVELDLGGVW